MKIRIVSEGWETFTGTLGFQATFEDGVSTVDLNQRQIARIGASLRVVDVETGLQVGPASVVAAIQDVEIKVASPVKTLDVVKVDEARERAALAVAEKIRVEAEKQALAAAQAKTDAIAAENEIVIYTRAELEAIASNDGIQGLRDIATPLKVKGRGITELVTEILAAQAKQAVV